MTTDGSHRTVRATTGATSRPIGGRLSAECSDMTSTRIIVTAAALLLAASGQALAAGPADAPPGALACSGCHPAARWVDTSVSRLTGRDPAAIVAAMQGFKSGQIPG